MSTRPTLVLIPGAWHVAEHYDLLTPLLEKEGYTCHALTLPSVGANPALTSLDPDVQTIRKHVIALLDEGKDVVVVMHSYGGIPGGSAMRGLSKTDRQKAGEKGGGVVGLVYICSWMIDEGMSMIEARGGRGGKGGPATLKIENDISTHLDPINAMYHDVPQEVAERMVAKMRPWSAPMITCRTTYAAHKFIPTTYIHAKGDKMIVYERQLEVVKEAGVPIASYTCEGGHSPFASRPEWVARVIRKAAGEDVEVGEG